MKKLLVPLVLMLVLMLVGVGGGVGAAMFLAPPADDTAELEEVCACASNGGDADGHDGAGGDLAQEVPADPNDPAAGYEYARLNNQFIVPVVTEERVTGLVVMTLSVEVQTGQKDQVFAHEPRLRNALLQVMFDHANLGGFDGVFTASDNMGSLRAALRNVARQEVGSYVTDVLVLDVVRQEVPG